MKSIREVREQMRWYYDLFIESLPPEIRELAREEIYIAGGAIRSCMIGEPIKDIDLWFKSDKMVQTIKDLKLGFTTDNAVTFYVATVQHQLIYCQVKSPEDMVAEFDFTMNQNYYTGRNLIVVKDVEAIENMQLKITNKCRNVLGTLARLHKFVERGYKIPSKLDLLRLGTFISREPVNTYKELETNSQLYFSEKDFYEIDFVEKPKTFQRLVKGTASGEYKL